MEEILDESDPRVIHLSKANALWTGVESVDYVDPKAAECLSMMIF
jgi:hypothetical protein